MVMHSATKYIGGHGDAMGGVVAGAADWIKDIRAIRAATGAVLHPQAAYTLHGAYRLSVRVFALRKQTPPKWRFNFATTPSLNRFTFLGSAIVIRRLVGDELRGPGAMLISQYKAVLPQRQLL